MIEATKINDIYQLKRCYYCCDIKGDNYLYRLEGRWDENKNFDPKTIVGSEVRYERYGVIYKFKILANESSVGLGAPTVFILLAMKLSISYIQEENKMIADQLLPEDNPAGVCADNCGCASEFDADLNLYRVVWDGQEHYVEAHSFGSAIAIWTEYAKQEWDLENQEPESVTLMYSDTPVIRASSLH